MILRPASVALWAVRATTALDEAGDVGSSASEYALDVDRPPRSQRRSYVSKLRLRPSTGSWQGCTFDCVECRRPDGLRNLMRFPRLRSAEGTLFCCHVDLARRVGAMIGSKRRARPRSSHRVPSLFRTSDPIRSDPIRSDPIRSYNYKEMVEYQDIKTYLCHKLD